MSVFSNMPKVEMIKLSDGRDLAFSIFGDPTGYPVFYCHGSPGSRLEGLVYQEKAAEYGLKLIVPDRPGFGKSSFYSGRKLLDFPDDNAELAKHLSAEEYGIIGHSGGGPYSLISRYADPEHVKFSISIGGYTNFGQMSDAADFLQTKADRLAVSLSQSHPKLFRLFFELLSVAIKYVPKSYMRALVKASGAADREIIETQAFRSLLIEDQKEALVQGGHGAALDCVILYEDWGACLEDFPDRIVLFQGTEDRLVPVEFARHLAANISGSELVVLEEQGHLFPWQQQDLIFQTARDQIGSLDERIEPVAAPICPIQPRINEGEQDVLIHKTN